MKKQVLLDPLTQIGSDEIILLNRIFLAIMKRGIVISKLGYALLPLVIGIGFSTVYLGLHHAIDPIFGYIWSAICYPIALKLVKQRGEDPLIHHDAYITREQ